MRKSEKWLCSQWGGVRNYWVCPLTSTRFHVFCGSPKLSSKYRDLPVKADKSELHFHPETRSKKNRSHTYIMPEEYCSSILSLLQSLSPEIQLPCIILIFVSTFVCNCRIKVVVHFLLLASPAVEELSYTHICYLVFGTV